MSKPLMKCGHAANGHTTDGKPCCAICFGIDPGATEVDPTPPNLRGRFAHCAYGHHAKVPSSTDLAFFEHHADKPEDIYYCGCRGWD